MNGLDHFNHLIDRFYLDDFFSPTSFQQVGVFQRQPYDAWKGAMPTL